MDNDRPTFALGVVCLRFLAKHDANRYLLMVRILTSLLINGLCIVHTHLHIVRCVYFSESFVSDDVIIFMLMENVISLIEKIVNIFTVHIMTLEFLTFKMSCQMSQVPHTFTCLYMIVKNNYGINIF